MPADLYTLPTALEPLFPERGEVALSELAAEVFKRSGALFGRLPVIEFSLRDKHFKRKHGQAPTTASPFTVDSDHRL